MVHMSKELKVHLIYTVDSNTKYLNYIVQQNLNKKFELQQTLN